MALIVALIDPVKGTRTSHNSIGSIGNYQGRYINHPSRRPAIDGLKGNLPETALDVGL